MLDLWYGRNNLLAAKLIASVILPALYAAARLIFRRAVRRVARARRMAVTSGAILATIGFGFVAQWSIPGNVTTGIVTFRRFPIHAGARAVMLSDQEFSAVADEFTPLFVILQDDDGNKVTIPNSLPQQMFVAYRNPGRRRELDPAEATYLPPDDARDDDAA